MNQNSRSQGRIFFPGFCLDTSQGSQSGSRAGNSPGKSLQLRNIGKQEGASRGFPIPDPFGVDPRVWDPGKNRSSHKKNPKNQKNRDSGQGSRGIPGFPPGSGSSLRESLGSQSQKSRAPPSPRLRLQLGKGIQARAPGIPSFPSGIQRTETEGIREFHRDRLQAPPQIHGKPGTSSQRSRPREKKPREFFWIPGSVPGLEFWDSKLSTAGSIPVLRAGKKTGKKSGLGRRI